MKQRITFYTPDFKGETSGFGCASYGIAGVEGIYSSHLKTFDLEIGGDVLCGSYQSVLCDTIKLSKTKTYKAAIVLLGNSGDENNFVKMLYDILQIPIVGGGAAMNLQTGESGLLSCKGQVNLFLIDDDEYDIQTSFCCIHETILSSHHLKLKDVRTIDTIDGIDAKQFFVNIKEKLEIDMADFEHLTLTNSEGVNSHLRDMNGEIKSGCDLSENMDLRFINQNDVYSRVDEFYQDACSIVFGCAGIKGMLERDINTNSLGLFLFGEVCFTGKDCEFGNLMLSKMRFIKNAKV